METGVTLYPEGDCQLLCAPVRDSGSNVVRPNTICVRPDFCLVRNQCRSTTPESDRRNVLFGLMMANIPSVNSLESIYMCLERPIMYSVMREIETRLGHNKFPLIPMTYYSNHKQMVISSDFPSVMKISHAHRGQGKIKLKSQEEFRDMQTVLALHTQDYATVEPFIEADYGLRIQKIGNCYHAFRKDFTGSGWKSQFGGSSLREVEMEPKWKLWADECSKVFGGLDILAVDALHSKDGREYIIELNDSPIGLTPGYWNTDSEVIRSIVLDKMNALFCNKN